MSISTHILDTARGRPAVGVSVRLEQETEDGTWKEVGSGITDVEGRVTRLVAEGQSAGPGTYRLTFETAAYFDRRAVPAFHPSIQIDFVVTDADEHYHVPLLLSPFGYTTYRGS